MKKIDKNSAGRYVSLIAAGVLLLSSASCGMIEMRDSVSETEQQEESTALMLAPAERKNTVETRAETDAVAVIEEPAAEVELVFTGDLLIDESIISDAADRASDGKSYSFIRMYTGVFNQISGADIAMGYYSAADVPAGSSGEQKTPIESLAALADLGYDVLDTSNAANDAAVMEEYGVLDSDVSGDIMFVEREGLVFAYLSLDEADTDKVKLAAEEADVVAASMNWSEDTTDEDRRNIAKELALAGADIIVGDGSELGGIEWINTGDGSPSIAAYSLGNLIATSDEPKELCGGLLELTVTEKDGEIKIDKAVFEPTVVRYTEGGTDYQLILLEGYNTDLSADHAVSGVNADSLLPYVRETVAAEFLKPGLRG